MCSGENFRAVWRHWVQAATNAGASMAARAYRVLKGEKPVEMPNTTWLTRAVGCVLFSPQAPSPAVTASIRGWSGDGGNLVSQRGEEPKARSQASLDRSEGARWSSPQDPRRSRTAAQIMQTGDRPRA